jgi:hypothetical protein
VARATHQEQQQSQQAAPMIAGFVNGSGLEADSS